MSEMQDDKCCPAKIPSISDRLEFLFENPLLVQELIFKEKCLSVRQMIDLPCTSDLQDGIWNQYKTVSIERLFSSYRSGELHLRVVNTRDRPMVFAVPPECIKDFKNICKDAYETLLQDWENAPPVVIELFNSPFTFDHGSRYGVLVYDVAVHAWEFVGCLAPLNTDRAVQRPVPDPTIRLMEYFKKNMPVS